MSQGWTIALVLAVAGGAGLAGFIWGQKRGKRFAGPAMTRGPAIDPKVAAAAIVASQGAKKLQKV